MAIFSYTCYSTNVLTHLNYHYATITVDNSSNVTIEWTDLVHDVTLDNTSIVSSLGVAALTTGTSSGTVASGDHTHGNITNGGDITTTATIASGDRLVINDESESKINNSSITFGTSTTQFLANNGTWQSAGTPQTATVSVPYQLWGSNTDLPITVTGMTSSATVWVSPNPSSATNIDNYNNAKLYCSAQATNSLTFTYAGTKPTADIDVNVVWIK